MCSGCGSFYRLNIGTGVGDVSITEDLPLSVLVENASVTYRVYETASIGLKDAIRARSLRRRVNRRVRALDGVDVEIRLGESVALIGHNGAGKSTLLRAIAGLQPLDGGSVRVSSPPRLLGVQAMLSGSWTGRQSIETGLIAQGLDRSQALARIDDVACFAKLSDVLDLPTSTYSAGMRARLYFAISTEVGGDILLIDEALAAGDAAFQKSAKDRLQERLRDSKTLILVSHSMTNVRELCDRAILLSDGRVIDDGPVDEVVNLYEQSSK